MTVIECHPPGTCAWVELNTTDADAATSFYTGLFGWEVHRTPVGPDLWYNTYQMGGRNVAASFTMTPAMVAQRLPPRWVTYFAVTSADAVAGTAASLGAVVVKPPFDVGDVGRMAALADPEGAMFALWEARSHPGLGRRDEPGALRWNELMAFDVEAAVRFYCQLFGMGSVSMPLPDGSTYHLLTVDGVPSAGILRITPDMGSIPACWLPYFGATDCDVTIERVTQLGGAVSVQPTTVSGAGRFAVAVDPQGAHFGLLSPEGTG